MHEPSGAALANIFVESFFPLIIVVGFIVLGSLCMLVEKLLNQLEIEEY